MPHPPHPARHFRARLAAAAVAFSLTAAIASAANAQAIDSTAAPQTAAPDSATPGQKPAAAHGADREGRNLPRDLGRALKTFGSDAWYVVSSPARLDRKGALWLGATLAVGGVIYAYDQDLLDASRRNREEPVYRQLQEAGDFLEPVGFMGNTNPFYIGAVGLGYAFRIEPLEEIPAQILESHMIAGGLRNAAKLLIGRRRPNEKKGSRAFEFNGGTSFPSGHTSVVFELATILSHHAHRLPVTVALYTAAGTVGLERIQSGNHWPSDVFLSAISGTLVARTLVRRQDERQRLALVPVVAKDGTPLLGVRLDF